MRVPKVIWQGHIEEIRENILVLRMYEQSGNDLIMEYMDMEIEKIPEEERQYIELGRIFTFEVGLEDNDENKPYYDFQFSKLPDWTEEEREEIKKRAEEWRKNLNWEDPGDNITF